MTDKEKYTVLMQRYFEGETTPEEERDLARYVAKTDDPEFDELRGVLGYLSIGRQETRRRSRAVRFYAYALAASVAIVAALTALGGSPTTQTYAQRIGTATAPATRRGTNAMRSSQ